jgi:hypothetical protein
LERNIVLASRNMKLDSTSESGEKSSALRAHSLVNPPKAALKGLNPKSGVLGLKPETRRRTVASAVDPARTWSPR